MALNMNRTALHLLLMLSVVICLVDKCPQKCKCSKKKGKLKVDCRGKGITEIFPQREFPTDMKILDLSKNNISIIRRGFLDLHYKLERLFLQKNLIKVLEERAFVGLDGLDRLNISKNKLVQLNKEAFLGLQKLDVLDLADNSIKSIDSFAFRGLKGLSKVVLKNNNFTTISNGTFDELTSLRKIDLKSVPLNCDCHLNSFVRFFEKLVKAGALKVPGRCRISREKFTDLKGINLCEKPPEIFIDPIEDQIVSVGDSLEITCETTPKARRPVVKLYWTKNQNSLPKHVLVTAGLLEKKFVSYVKFDSIRWQDGGTYKCYGSRLTPKEITIRVITSKNPMCPRDLMKIRNDHVLWPVTLERTTAIVPCPPWPHNYAQGVDTNIRRTCTEKGVWGPENIGNCQFESLTEKLIRLGNLLKKDDFVDITKVAEKLKLLTYPSSFQTAANITLVFNVFAGIILKNIPFRGQLLDDMLASFNNIMDVNDGALYAAQQRDQSPSRIGARLELISRGIVNETRVLRNIVIDSVDLKKLRSRESMTCNVFFWSEIQPGGVYCEPSTREGYSVSIYIPSTIFKSLHAAGHKNSPRLQFLVYRNAKLYPNVISNMTDDNMRDRNISSSVLAIQMANIEELNLTDPLVIRFATQPGTEPIISYFDFGGEGVGRPWSQNTDCVVKDSTVSMTTVECIRLVNKNLAIMSHLGKHSGITNVVFNRVEIVVYLGAVVTSLLLIATLITFALARNVRFNRDDIIMLMNACLALLVVVLSFAFGILRTESAIVCRAMGMSLHFFFFASLLWLASYVYCVTRRLMPQKETEEAFNPVLMYYMVSWGVPAIICGMTVAGDIKNYKATDYCWLTESVGLGAFVGPACLLFLIIAFLLVRLHLLLARGIADPRPRAENTEEERLQTDEPGVLEEVPDPSEMPNPEKSTVTLYLVATWVLIFLIYLNFILAYFLVNSRTSKLRWIFLSYVYALANVALGGALFGFHCVARPKVREAWRLGWKVFRGWKISCGLWRTLWITMRKNDTPQTNGRILVNGESITHRIESDRQSNITLPSSAALTNDVFVNGRPMSTARVSLLDEADFPPEESPRGGPVDNEVDVNETGNSEENQRSQSSIHSDRKGRTRQESIPEESEGNTRLLTIPDETLEDHAEITDGVTSKSESSAPTAIEVTELQTPARADSPTVEYPLIVPHAGMIRPFMGNGMRQFPPPNQVVHPNQAPPVHQFRPLFQAPFTHQAMPPAYHVPPVYQGQPTDQVPPSNQVPPAHQPPPALYSKPAPIEPPPSYQKYLDLMASQSSSSVGDNSALSRSNSKRKRSSESLGSRNESGSVGPRARKLTQLQSQASSSSAISEVPAPGPVLSRPSETTNARSAAQNLGASSNNSRPANRYRDGRAKPEPKKWSSTTQNKIAYVPIPHVSKIHREPLHDETSV